MTKIFDITYTHDNTLVVDKEAKIKNADFMWDSDIKEILRKFSIHQNNYEYKIIASTIKIPNSDIPLIKLEKSIELLSNEAFDLMGNHSTVTVWEEQQFKVGYKLGYEEAQSKIYTEEDLITAFNSGRKGFGGGMKRKVYDWKNPYDYVQSLQLEHKQVELEMEEDYFDSELEYMYYKLKVVNDYVIVKKLI